MRTTALFLIGTSLAAAAAAHDFWIQPDAFTVAVGAPVPFTILVGHGTFRQRWGAAIERVVRLDSIGPAGRVDRRAALLPPGGVQDISINFAQPGTQVIVLETNRAVSELPAIRFNDYLKVEGLTPAIRLRAARGRTDTPGRELYSRRAKALVQVGPADTGAQPQVTRPAGLTLEIVPQRNPYSLAPGEMLPVVVLYEGKPLAGALVKLNNLDFDARPIETHLTDAAGRTMFDPPRRGKWQLNVIWTRPLSGDPRADFDTVFSSLTFGFPTPAAVMPTALPRPSSG